MFLPFIWGLCAASHQARVSLRGLQRCLSCFTRGALGALAGPTGYDHASNTNQLFTVAKLGLMSSPNEFFLQKHDGYSLGDEVDGFDVAD